MNAPTHRHRSPHRRAGAASVLAMMFLVIFGSLAAAMAIVAQGNLSTADAHLKINRSLAAAETGMNFIIYRLNAAATTVKTRDGLITAGNAATLWNQTRAKLKADLSSNFHNLAEPTEVGATLVVGPIAIGPGAPTFTAALMPHPLAGEDYNSAYYQRPPYSTMATPVSNTNPLDATWLRIRVQAADGPAGRQITRAIQMDFKIDKKIRFAILSKSRVMIGRNVVIQGAIGSRFLETNLAHGHPVQMVSDFRGLDSALDAQIDAFVNSVATNDQNGDNRLNLADTLETAGIANPGQFDTNGDGYIEDYDFFIAKYDANGDGKISNTELNTSSNIYTAQLMQLIDTFGSPGRPGYNDGFIDNSDRYAKIRGEVKISAAMAGWQAGAAGGAYQQYMQGPITAGHNETPLTFEADDTDVHDFTPADFDTTSFASMASGDLAAQASTQAADHDPSDPTSPGALGQVAHEAIPFGAQYPYDYYHRPVYENMTFTNVTIPKGTNALFKNCKFIGCTFVETSTGNTDPNFNYAGTQEPDGSLRYPTTTATVGGTAVADTKPLSNNIRFDGCTFEGAIVSDSPTAYTHLRNKIAFTGTTRWVIDGSSNLTSTQKALFKRSTILMPHYSLEMGSFVAPSDPNETVELSGTIVVGVMDVRGQVKLSGTILTTFMPQSGVSPVLGNTSPQFNTTLGYFGSATGDLEAELPADGIGVVQIRYDPTLPLPDGILGPIEVRADYTTYFEARN